MGVVIRLATSLIIKVVSLKEVNNCNDIFLSFPNGYVMLCAGVWCVVGWGVVGRGWGAGWLVVVEWDGPNSPTAMSPRMNFSEGRMTARGRHCWGVWGWAGR